jgi:hypothetical protein
MTKNAKKAVKTASQTNNEKFLRGRAFRVAMVTPSSIRTPRTF